MRGQAGRLHSSDPLTGLVDLGEGFLAAVERHRRKATQLFAAVFADGTQVIQVDESADLPTLVGTGLLVETEVDAAVNAGVVDIVGDLFPGRVIESQAQ